MSQGLSEKAHAATGLTDGSNLVYCATIYYTYKQKKYLYEYVICAGAEKPNPATHLFQNAQLVPPFQNQFEINGGIMMSYPNQKIVQIVERTPRDGKHLYSMNNLDALQQAMNCLKGSGLKMWLYINKNRDNYRFELSQKACEEWGIKKDSYYVSLRDLEDHGYLRPIRPGSNIYHFFENALAENPTFGEINYYHTENQKYFSENEKSTYDLPKGTAENPERNNINNTRIIKDNKASTFPKKETKEEAYRRLGF